jgi:predicted nucleic acid-binding Zn ribbon protein
VSTHDPVPLADALAAVGEELGLPSGDAFATLVARWDEVVGSDVAAHAHLESVRDGVATVAVDDPLWASQLRYLETAMVDRAATVVGADVVRAVRVRVRPG